MRCRRATWRTRDPLEDSLAEAAWRRHRLERELLHIGVDLGVLPLGQPLQGLSGQLALARPAVDAFLWPGGPEELAVTRVPGRARTIAASLAFATQRAQARAAAELRNSDRTLDEVREAPLGPRAPLIVLLDGLSAIEVGCLLRTCEAAHVQAVLLCGKTPGPPDPQVLKTSLHAEDWLPHRRVSGAAEALHELHAEGCRLWGLAGVRADGMEEHSGRIETAPQPLALVLGGGPSGAVTPEVLALCDGPFWLSMEDSASAEVGPGVAGSIAIFDIVRQWRL